MSATARAVLGSVCNCVYGRGGPACPPRIGCTAITMADTQVCPYIDLQTALDHDTIDGYEVIAPS
jgi:hypothetical protein